MILELLHDAFAQAKIPKSFYETKKIINKLSPNHKKIHACLNNCMLYWGKNADREKSNKCHTLIWKPNGNDNGRDAQNGRKKRKKTPSKVLHYFPLKPLQNT